MRFIKERRLLHFGFGGLEMGGDGSESAETQDKTPEAKEKENDNVEDPEQLIADELQKAEKEVDKSKKNVGKRLRDQADNFDKMAADAREKGDEQKASNLEADAALLRKSAASVEAAQNAGQKSLDDPKEGKTESDKDANPEKKTTTIDDAIDQLDDDAKLDPGKGPEETFNEIHKDKIAKKVGEQFCKTHNIPPENAKDVADVLKNPDAQKFFTELIDGLDAEDGPKTPEEVKAYKDLLAQGLVEPTEMELYICNADGSNLRQLTSLGNANWSPFFHPSGKKILFSSNFEAERGFPFNLYMIDLDGKNLKRITHGETFDAFPVFSNDGKWLAFSSNRNNGGGRDTNLFIAEWQE